MTTQTPHDNSSTAPLVVGATIGLVGLSLLPAILCAVLGGWVLRRLSPIGRGSRSSRCRRRWWRGPPEASTYTP